MICLFVDNSLFCYMLVKVKGKLKVYSEHWFNNNVGVVWLQGKW